MSLHICTSSSCSSDIVPRPVNDSMQTSRSGYHLNIPETWSYRELNGLHLIINQIGPLRVHCPGPLPPSLEVYSPNQSLPAEMFDRILGVFNSELEVIFRLRSVRSTFQSLVTNIDHSVIQTEYPIYTTELWYLPNPFPTKLLTHSTRQADADQGPCKTE